MDTNGILSCFLVLLVVGIVIAGIAYASHGLKRSNQSLLWLWFFVSPLFGIIPVVLAYRGLKQMREVDAQKERSLLEEAVKRRERLQREEEERKKEEADRPARLAAAEAAQQRAFASRLSSLASECKEMAARIPLLVQEAEKELDLAEQALEEGLLDPFWDAIERAVTKLATVESQIQALIRKGEIYCSEATKVTGGVPRLDLGLATFPDVGGTERRMHGIIRRSQKSLDFTQIFHLRKVTKVLVAGFSSLGHALNDLGNRLASSQERLFSTFSISISDLVENQREGTSAIVGELTRHREDSSAATRELKEQLRTDATVEQKMLDNMQRRKRPPPMLGDGQY
jgi:phosphate/sulfate permease